MSNVAWNIIVPVKQPKDLKGIAPGKLPESLLRPAVGGGKLHWLANAAWGAMGAEAAAYLSLESGEAACRTIEAEIIRR